MQLSLISPEQPLFTGDVEMVIIPGTEGEFGVLPGHAPFVSTLRPGVVTINPESPSPARYVVLDGVAEITPEHCIILAEMAESLEGLTRDAIQARVNDARAALEATISDEAKHKAEKQLLIAETLIQHV